MVKNYPPTWSRQCVPAQVQPISVTAQQHSAPVYNLVTYADIILPDIGLPIIAMPSLSQATYRF
jgi:hypothetical protein